MGHVQHLSPESLVKMDHFQKEPPRNLKETTGALPSCVDGSELARTFLNVCSIGRCSHVFGLFTRFT
jgi:hypothetical protein